MKRWLIGIAGAIVLLVIAGYVCREPLMNAMFERMTANMFVAKDDDPYDPGLPVGAHAPALRALYRGRGVCDIAEVMGRRGLVLYVNRSVDW